MESVGQILKTARTAKNLSYDDVEKGTSIRRIYIEAIENDEYHKAPGEVFVKGIIRTYGNFLGLNGTELVDMYKAQKTGADVEDIKSQGIREVNNVKLNISLKQQRSLGSGTGFSLSSIQLPWKQIAAGIAVIAIVGAGYLAVPKIMALIPASSITSTETTSENIPEAAPKPPVKADKVTVEMSASGSCWLEVTADGKEAFVGMLQAKDKKTFEAKDKLIVKYGNIGVMSVSVNGVPENLQGQKGVAVKTYTR